MNRAGLGGAVVACVFVVAAAGAPLLAPYDPGLLTGPPLALPSAAHLLGTNDVGQDILSRLLYGVRTSLFIAGSVAGLSALLSWAVGLAAGMSRLAETLLMPLTDLLLALPSLPLYLLTVTLVGPSLTNLELTLALLSWPSFARIVRSLVLAVRAAPYVEAAQAMGATRLHVALRHLLPATLDVLPTKLILTVRFAVFTEATLAFLGLGDPATVSCGTMLSHAFDDPLLFTRPVWPWLVLPPALAVAGLVLTTVALSRSFEAWLAPGGSAGRQPRGAAPAAE
jgi:ABC-type dipeptide/oligopeptide/nickel transport system permease subunit